jgi:hypothetical protein
MSTNVPPANEPPRGAEPAPQKQPHADTVPAPVKPAPLPVHNPGTRTNTGANKFK